MCAAHNDIGEEEKEDIDIIHEAEVAAMERIEKAEERARAIKGSTESKVQEITERIQKETEAKVQEILGKIETEKDAIAKKSDTTSDAVLAEVESSSSKKKSEAVDFIVRVLTGEEESK